jgi:hypothetical protein
MRTSAALSYTGRMNFRTCVTAVPDRISLDDHLRKTMSHEGHQGSRRLVSVACSLRVAKELNIQQRKAAPMLVEPPRRWPVLV